MLGRAAIVAVLMLASACSADDDDTPGEELDGAIEACRLLISDSSRSISEGLSRMIVATERSIDASPTWVEQVADLRELQRIHVERDADGDFVGTVNRVALRCQSIGVEVPLTSDSSQP